MTYRTAIITGASSGIGSELARQLARKGVAVGVIARRQDRLDRLQNEIASAGGTCVTAVADVVDRESLTKAIKDIEAQLGETDLLIANAGINTGSSVENFKLDVIRRVYDVNVMGTLHAIEAVMEGMIRRERGHIVGVSSVASFRGFPIKSAYCGSKAAVRVHMEGLRAELQPYGITVSTICPGFVESEMTSTMKTAKPFILKTDIAAGKMIRAIYARKPQYIFPWQMNFLIGMLRMIPPGLYTHFSSRQKKKYRHLKAAR